MWEMYRAWLAADGLRDAVTVQDNSSAGLLSAVRATLDFLGPRLAALLLKPRDPT